MLEGKMVGHKGDGLERKSVRERESERVYKEEHR